jgi:hypothetical protein
MRKVFFIVGLLLLTAGIASASCPRFEFGGGYAYTRVGSEFGLSGGSGTNTSTNLNGWDAEADYDLTCWIAGVANFTGVYKSVSGASAHVYTETFGPRVNLHNPTPITPFVEALFGAGQFGINGCISCISSSINAFAGFYGGGVDVGFGGPFAVRTQIGDVSTHFANQFQNSLGVTAEFVIKLGGH